MFNFTRDTIIRRLLRATHPNLVTHFSHAIWKQVYESPISLGSDNYEIYTAKSGDITALALHKKDGQWEIKIIR